MNTRGGEQAIPLAGDEIESILNMPKVTNHVRRMFRIGTVKMQESGFAVYERPKGFYASKLLIPSVTELSIDSPNIGNQLSTFDASSLVTRQEKGKEDVPGLLQSMIEGETEDEYYERLYPVLSDKAQAKIDRIQAHPDLDEEHKKSLILEIRVRDADKSNEANGKGRLRNDVVLLAHNHPIDPAVHENIDSITRPSPQDLDAFTETHRYNPRHIEAIVGSDKVRHRMLLLGSKAGVDVQPEHYAGRADIDTHMQRTLEILADSGFVACLINLQANGVPEVESHRQIHEFANRLRDK